MTFSSEFLISTILKPFWAPVFMAGSLKEASRLLSSDRLLLVFWAVSVWGCYTVGGLGGLAVDWQVPRDPFPHNLSIPVFDNCFCKQQPLGGLAAQ